MAALTFYLVNAADANGYQALSESTQTAANCACGWVVGTGSTNHSELAANSERASSTFTGTGPPDGVVDTSLKDAMRSPNALTGSFASANWSLQFAVVSPTQGGAADGRVRVRLVKADADGSNQTEITNAQQQCALVSNVASSPDSNSTLTFNPGAFTITNQYLFFQVAWERTGAGGMTTTNIRFRTGSASTPTGTVLVTSNFTAGITFSATAPIVTISAPTATRVATRTLTATAPLARITAPTASILAPGPPQTLVATAPLARITAPTANRLASVALVAGAPLVRVTAPAAVLQQTGPTVLAATAPIASFSAPTAVRVAAVSLVAGAPTVTLTAPIAVRVAGGVSLVAGAPRVLVSAPVAVLAAGGGGGASPRTWRRKNAVRWVPTP